ncbi:gliding motility-associated C-terminal domain-containing protein [Mangrovimonas sp. YM274]|uniref:DUF7933 domain-containing protein n=1 Tax=Mangrovimonas sp. YM274 TaxID=3070660 RepID=UPI0027DD9A2F|nr:gliding motility-associated C-terminal domain-containing protein [Mangrovimonas sp. YM274]WMI69105.1 gliding motility-associated C-terminal domain-containing protein [Mangrovimonas sp. YM274]
MSLKKVSFVLFFCFAFLNLQSQTTDLAVVVEAQNLSGTDISQVEIYEQFQYVVTIINSGNAVNNASFSVEMSNYVTVVSYESQNNLGGASAASGFSLSAGNILTGTVASLPNNASVEIQIIVHAPVILGGIAVNAAVSPPDSTTDTNPNNNESIISMGVIDIPIDFTVTYAQINPTAGTGISAWNDTVTYEFTITNNSSIDFPLNGFFGKMSLNSNLNGGSPVVALQSLECIGATNGTECPDVSEISASPVVVSGASSILVYNNTHLYTSGGSVTFQVTYQFLNATCAMVPYQISVDSFVSIDLDHTNESSNLSNEVTTPLLNAEPCDLTDICIDTVQISPDVSQVVNWGEEVVFETTVCNNGPMDAPIVFFLQNLSPSVQWDIISVECTDTTGNVSCDDFTLSIQDALWSTSTFDMPVGATITITTTVIFLEPECSTSIQNTVAHVRSGTNILQAQLFDTNIENSAQSDYVTLPPTSLCPSSDITVAKTQIDPAPPEGTSALNTTDWGPITYEITVSNLGNEDTFIILSDYMTLESQTDVLGELISVECSGTTGTAQCFPIAHAYLNTPQDGVPEDGENDIFWEILTEDNWVLPGQSSVSFQATVNWQTECSAIGVPVVNNVSINHANDTVIDPNSSNNTVSTTSYLAPCIDLIVQTFPEFTQVPINQDFDWIVDISNSVTSSNATDIMFENVLGNEFAVNGTPTCEIITGTATCINTFTVTENTITGTIPNMEAGAIIRVTIPVTAPNYGGAFNNTAKAIPNGTTNHELTPETNISISNIQVIAPTLVKAFTPDTIMENQESVLEFTIYNINSNPAQSEIAFTDNLPNGLVLSGTPYWTEDNGCTATFTGNQGDTAIGINNLTFPDGVESCKFAVTVTSSITGTYINDSNNFTDLSNIDVSQTFAQLTVIEDTSDVDIEVLKSVTPEDVSIGGEVTFVVTATNLGTTIANNIVIADNLPLGYEYLSATVSLGNFDMATFIWNIPILQPGQSETLTMTARVRSSEDLLNVAFLEDVNELDRNPLNNNANAFVTVDNCLVIPEGLSPNADGFNDFLVIPCIEDYIGNILKIYNRLGVQIYESSNYQNNWDGRPNMGFPETNKVLPVGTYYYLLELPNNQKPIIGWIYLNY